MSRTFYSDILHVADDHPFLQQRSMRSDLALAACLLDEAEVDPDSFGSGIHAIKCPHNHIAYKMSDLITDAVSPRRVKGAFDVVNTGCHADDVVLLVDGIFTTDHDEALRVAILANATVVVISNNFSNLTREFPLIADRLVTLPKTLSDDAIRRTIKAVTGDDTDAQFGGEITSKDIVMCVRGSIEGASAIAKLRAILEQSAGGNSNDDCKPQALPIAKAADAVVTHLSDLSGYGAAKDWGLQLAADLSDYKAGKLTWDDVDKGILLSGAPGTGKTFYARALAAECDVPLVVTSYSDWHTASSGDTVAKSLNKIFGEWRKKAADGPLIVFVDEFDSIGSRGGNGHSEAWYRTIINAWLAFLDGAEPRTNIIVVAATNLPEQVDPALLRPGRLDRHVVIPAPTIADLKGIIKHHLGIGADLKGLDAAAVACRGKTPATIAQAVRDARRLARRATRKLRASDVATVVSAGRPQRSADDDRVIAIHEAAHALSAHVLDTGLRHVDVDDSHALVAFKLSFLTRTKLEDHVTGILSGRAANILYTGGAIAGASDDLRSATDIVRRLVAQFGMVGNLVYFDDTSATLDRRITDQVSEILDACDARARKLLTDHKVELFAIADALLKRRYLDAAEVSEIVSTARVSDCESPHC